MKPLQDGSFNLHKSDCAVGIDFLDIYLVRIVSRKALSTYRNHMKVASILNGSDFVELTGFELGTARLSVGVVNYLTTVTFVQDYRIEGLSFLFKSMQKEKKKKS